MPPWVIIVLFLVVMDGVSALLVWYLIVTAWKPLQSRHPEQEHGPDGVTRTFQSFRFGVINFGYCVHVTADDRHLHLRPARLLRWFGARTVSVPWGEITIKKRSRIGKWTTVNIGGQSIMGPAWCLDLADPKTVQSTDESSHDTGE